MTASKELSTPLEGIRMLDLGRYQAGPRCALMFARMGAEVIKVESLKGEDGRKNPPLVRGQSAYWVQYNSGKKSLAIDLRKEKGKKILGDLVKISETSGISFELLKIFQKKAYSILRDEIYQIKDFKFPDKAIYFDLETEPGGGRIWLIGCLIKDMPFQFYADTWIEEYGIIRNFLDLVDRDDPWEKEKIDDAIERIDEIKK